MSTDPTNWLEGTLTRVKARRIYKDVEAERMRQEAKFPGQVLPVGTGADKFKVHAGLYRDYCERAFQTGEATWVHVLLEEVYEALAEEPGSPNLRAEFVQVAAVCVRVIEQLDRESEG